MPINLLPVCVIRRTIFVTDIFRLIPDFVTNLRATGRVPLTPASAGL